MDASNARARSTFHISSPNRPPPMNGAIASASTASASRRGLSTLTSSRTRSTSILCSSCWTIAPLLLPTMARKTVRCSFA